MILSCGEALWDLFAADGPDGRVYEARPGGAPLNVAVGLARLGQRAGLLAGISTDPPGERLAGFLRREGVDTRFLVRGDSPSGLSLVEVDAGGEPAYAIYGPGTADRMIAAADLPRLAGVAALHLGSFALVTEPAGPALIDLAHRARGGPLVSLDPNPRLAVAPDRDLWRDRLGRAAAAADLVKASEADIDALFPGRAIESVAADWARAGAALVVVTRGGQGALAFAGGAQVAVPAPAVEVVDAVGAGDAVAAALLAGLAETDRLSRPGLDGLAQDQAALGTLLRFAVQAGSLACTRRGADPPRRDALPPLPPG